MLFNHMFQKLFLLNSRGYKCEQGRYLLFFRDLFMIIGILV